MGHSQADKARNRERILQQAAAQIRDSGLESIAVGPLMRSVDLTHGGFYGHFESRSQLLAQALERALEDGRAASAKASSKASGAASDTDQPLDFHSFVRGYLSRSHRDSRQGGCAIAALASDVARADERSREVMQAHIERLIERVGTAMQADDAQAVFAVSALVGGLLLARVATDPQRSDAMLRAVKAGLGVVSSRGARAGQSTIATTPESPREDL